jgi:hypothetical protein
MTKNRRPLKMLNKPVREALESVLSYLWDDEERSYAEAPREDHVFLKLEAVRTWLDGLSELPSEY